MKKTLTVLGFTIISLTSIFVNVQAQSQKRFSKEEIKSDLNYLRDTLEARVACALARVLKI
jgi:sensor domain CHASE-containing protein